MRKHDGDKVLALLRLVALTPLLPARQGTCRHRKNTPGPLLLGTEQLEAFKTHLMTSTAGSD